uniref:Ubiquitin-like domain-containing protein n=1 Tax=Panagrolaimus davidi TaxID=227884 RepID=A0A914PBW3_9BILA
MKVNREKVRIPKPHHKKPPTSYSDPPIKRKKVVDRIKKENELKKSKSILGTPLDVFLQNRKINETKFGYKSQVRTELSHFSSMNKPSFEVHARINGHLNVTVKCSCDNTVPELKEKVVQKMCGSFKLDDVARISIYFGSKLLENGKSINDYGITESSVLQVKTFSLFGGNTKSTDKTRNERYCSSSSSNNQYSNLNLNQDQKGFNMFPFENHSKSIHAKEPGKT